jgi:hypothetical protein
MEGSENGWKCWIYITFPAQSRPYLVISRGNIMRRNCPGYGAHVARKFYFSNPPHKILHERTPWNWALLQTLTVTQLVKKFSTFYGTRKFHDRVQMIPPLVPILSQMNPVYTLPSSLPKIHSNIVLHLPTYLPTYLPNPIEHSPSWEANKSHSWSRNWPPPPPYVTQRFIIVFTTARNWSLS